MSVRSLTALALERDRVAAGEPAGGGAGAAAVSGGGSRSRRDAVPQSFTDVVISAIPTEPLAAYTALVGIVIGAVGRDDSYLPFRWGAYGAFLAIVVAAVWLAYARAARGPLGGDHRRNSFPGVEVGSALLAGGAWGLAMPGSPLDAALSGTARTLTTASVLIGTAAVLSLLAAPALKTGTSSRKKAEARAKVRAGGSEPGSESAVQVGGLDPGSESPATVGASNGSVRDPAAGGSQ